MSTASRPSTGSPQHLAQLTQHLTLLPKRQKRQKRPKQQQKQEPITPTQQVTLQLQLASVEGDVLHTVFMDTMFKYSRLCNMVSQVAFDTFCTDRTNLPRRIQPFELHRLVVEHDEAGHPISLYHSIRRWVEVNWGGDSKVGGFPANLVCQVIKQVAGTYSSLLTRYHNTRPERRHRLLIKPAFFKDTTSVQYDERTMNIKLLDPSTADNVGYGTMSTSTHRVPFYFSYGDNVRWQLMYRNAVTHETIAPWELHDHLKRCIAKHGSRPLLLGHNRTSATLIYRKTTTRRKGKRYSQRGPYATTQRLQRLPGTPGEGKFFLMLTLEKDVAEPKVSSPEAPLDLQRYLGVDLGINNIATTSAGTNYSGTELETHVNQYKRHRQGLQRAAKALPSKRRNRIYRKIRSLASKEARFRRDTNHRIAKSIVAEAQRTCSNVIVLEDLKYYRDQLKARRQQRGRMHGWSFHQLQMFIVYKARLVGIRVIFVDPRHTSQRCCICGHTERANRGSGSKYEQFVCKRCSHAAPADYNAALNIQTVGYVLDSKATAVGC